MSGRNTLLDISEDLMLLHDQLIEASSAGYEISDSRLQQALCDQEQLLDSKVDSYCNLIREFEARSKVRADEANRIKKRASVDANAAKRLREGLLFAMLNMNQEKLATPLNKVTVCKRKSTGSIEIVDEFVPDEFMTTVKVPDKDAIRSYLESETDPQTSTWARFTKPKPSLRLG